MADKQTLIKAVLTGSAAWTALCAAAETYLPDDLGRMGLAPNNSHVDANGKLLPSTVITFGTSIQAELPQSTEREFMTLWFYVDNSYSTLRAMRRKAKDLLNRKQLGATTDEKSPFLFWVNDTPERPDDSMGGALSCSSRYLILFRRG